MKKQTHSEQILIGQELIDHLKNNGIEQEVNRIFFHPLGIRLNINDQGEIEFYKTESPYGYIIEKINTFSRKIFMEFRSQKMEQREKKLGFAIQVKGLFRGKQMDDEALLKEHPNQRRINIIANSLHQFSFGIYNKLLQKQEEDKLKLKKIQLSYETKGQLLQKLQRAIEHEEWLDAGAYLILLMNINNIIEEVD